VGVAIAVLHHVDNSDMVVICGEALIDRIVGGTDSPGGGPFNTTRALARLGTPTQFLGRLSTDVFGGQLRELLIADGVDLAMTSVGPEPTTLAIADVDALGHAAYRFVSDGTSAPNLSEAMVPDSFGSDVGAIHVGTLGLVLEPIATTLAALVDREYARRMIMIDPNIRPFAVESQYPSPSGGGQGGGYRTRLDRIIAQSTVVKASEADAAWLFPQLDLAAAARALLARGPKLVVVTLGAEGAFGVCADAEIRVPAPAVQVVDTIGAGDAFGAALLAWLHDHGRLSRDLRLDRDDLQAALEFACLVASITCTRPGADPPWRSELTPGDRP
jgi:fructokinase